MNSVKTITILIIASVPCAIVGQERSSTGPSQHSDTKQGAAMRKLVAKPARGNGISPKDAQVIVYEHGGKEIAAVVESTEALRETFERYQAQAAATARKLRTLPAGQGDDRVRVRVFDPETGEQVLDAPVHALRKQLREEVAEAFLTRQTLLRVEANELEKRLERVKKLIADRDRNMRKIIDRRVSELLDAETGKEPSVRTNLGKEKPASPLAQNHKIDAGSSAVQRSHGVQSLIIRNASEYQRMFKDDRLSSKDLNFLREEFSAQLRLLGWEYVSAGSALELAKKTHEVRRSQHEQGRVGVVELNKAERDVMAAKIRVEQLNTLLDLYKKAGPAIEGDKRSEPGQQTPQEAFDEWFRNLISERSAKGAD